MKTNIVANPIVVVACNANVQKEEFSDDIWVLWNINGSNKSSLRFVQGNQRDVTTFVYIGIFKL